MTPEEALVTAMANSKEMTDKDRQDYFALLAAALIAYLRDAMGNEALNGFIYAAMRDNVSMSIDNGAVN